MQSLKCFLYLHAVVFFASIFSVKGQDGNFVDYVNPLMGTQSKYELSAGNTYPVIARPWGMNFWTPQTGKMGDGWIYTYDADKIRGFKQTHQPSPWMNDYGQFSIMPITGNPVFNEDERASWFSHKAEIAKPYYYSVYLADHDVFAEMSPTSRAAMFRFTFPQREQSYVVIDAFDNGSYIKIIPEENKIIGYTTKNSGGVPDNFRNYFVVVFDKPFTFKTEVASENNHSGAIIGFPTKKGEKIHARVASSFISFEQAELNLKELGNNSFDQIKEQGRREWNELLGKIGVKDNSVTNLCVFYSCLYRSVLFPRSFYEIDETGNIVHYSPYNGKILPGYMFTDTGFWDTFRSLFPLLNLVYPSMSVKMQEGLVNAYKESGFLPEWASPGHRDCMIGNNSASVVVDAYLKGLRGYDIETLWQAVTHGANNVHPQISSTGRKGFDYYNKLGYIPYDVNINENAARTLEYAYNDWCIYQLGKSLGKPEKEIEAYKQRAFNYKNLFDKEHHLIRGRNKDGSFQSPFNPFKWGDAFTEGNSWHYTWSVFHDPQGLIDLMGGKKQFNQMVDSVFNLPPLFDESYYGFVIHEIREMQIMNMGNYAHGNQPIQHMIYLYNYSAEPWKAQYYTREVMDKLYSPTPDGYCGDEDNGQTSAWYVFSALGFYPVCPGTDEYIMGSPLFNSVTLNLENGKQIKITAENNNKRNRYIETMQVNGVPYTKNYLKHETLINGAAINFKMTDSPNKKRGINKDDVPYSFSTGTALAQDNTIVANKYQCQRPLESQRLFKSKAIENEIARIKKLLTNQKLAWMFGNCFPNTLDTTVHFRTGEDGKPDTFVYTGDIHAMWLRDSGAQVWPYVQFANSDLELKRLLAGVINRQFKCIIIDPYANAFNDGAVGGGWESDLTEMIPELHERKWEIDSLCYPIRLAYRYWQITGDASIFDDEWLQAVQSILRTFKEQQRKDSLGPYKFQRVTEKASDTVVNDGWGNPVKPVGLIASLFRPSDDAAVYQFLIPSNFFAVTTLRKAAEILIAVNNNSQLSEECTDLADEVEAALKKYATLDHPVYGKIYAYEVDGYGSVNLMDDANVPSLLAMPYLGDIDINDPVYQNTRKFVWSENNPYFFKGTAGEGIGGPHVSHVSLDMIWPMSIMMKAFTSQDDAEIQQCIQMLLDTDADTGFIHESFHKDDAYKFTREWFAWQNTLFGELILKLVNEGKIDLLNNIK